MLGAIARKLFGTTNDRIVKALAKSVTRINALEPDAEALLDWVNFLHAGSVKGALAELAREASQKEANARTKLDRVLMGLETTETIDETIETKNGTTVTTTKRVETIAPKN